MKESNAAVLTLLADANLKKPFLDGGIPLDNFKFKKKMFYC